MVIESKFTPVNLTLRDTITICLMCFKSWDYEDSVYLYASPKATIVLYSSCNRTS
jgi:hypothetical protein